MMEIGDDYGPARQVILNVIEKHVPALDRNRALDIMLMAGVNERTDKAQEHAFEAARTVPGREQQVVQASEALRRAIWEVIWDSTWADAWHMSWVVSRLGIGLATEDLIGRENYTLADYRLLVGPWLTAGFSDYPLWNVRSRDVA